MNKRQRKKHYRKQVSKVKVTNIEDVLGNSNDLWKSNHMSLGRPLTLEDLINGLQLISHNL